MKIGKEEGILVAKELAGLHHYRLQQSQPSIAVLEQGTSPPRLACVRLLVGLSCAFPPSLLSLFSVSRLSSGHVVIWQRFHAALSRLCPFSFLLRCIFIRAYVYGSSLVSKCSQKLGEAVGSPALGATGSCDLFDVNAETRTQVLWKSSLCVSNY